MDFKQIKKVVDIAIKEAKKKKAYKANTRMIQIFANSNLKWDRRKIKYSY
jgi:hypothetical protein